METGKLVRIVRREMPAKPIYVPNWPKVPVKEPAKEPIKVPVKTN